MHDADHRGDDAERRHRVADLVQRLRGRFAFDVMRLDFLVHEALDFERVHVAADHQAQHLLQLANDPYSGGLVAYLDVITARQQLLTSERQDVQIRGQQRTTSVALMKALGGGWNVDDAAQDTASKDSIKESAR